jgi:hypothetical protein
MLLLQSWREFIEVYVQSSPNRPDSYIVSVAAKTGDRPVARRVDSFESRDSNSDEDQPATPKSILHSHSQTSGHSPCPSHLDLLWRRCTFTEFRHWETVTSVPDPRKHEFIHRGQEILRARLGGDEATLDREQRT